MTRAELLAIAKPILFNTEMVRAILDGRKTVTRRVMKPQPFVTCEGLENECNHPSGFFDTGGNEWACSQSGCGIGMGGKSIYHAPYRVGDILYVRETWFYESHMEDLTVGEPDLPSGRYSHRYVYKATEPDYPVNNGANGDGWHPSIHMPKEAARIFLRVTGVRVERVQDIPTFDILHEGIVDEECDKCCEETGGCCPQKDVDVFCGREDILADKYADLWDSTINKADLDRYGWYANPWVWAIEFERMDAT